MEVLLDIDICSGLTCDKTFNVSDEDKKEIGKRAEFDWVCDAQYVNIGPGADVIVLLLIVDIGMRILKLGAEINEGIDGWIGLVKNYANYFSVRRLYLLMLMELPLCHLPKRTT